MHYRYFAYIALDNHIIDISKSFKLMLMKYLKQPFDIVEHFGSLNSNFNVLFGVVYIILLSVRLRFTSLQIRISLSRFLYIKYDYLHKVTD